MAKKKVKRKKMGRPKGSGINLNHYKPEYAERIVDLMKDGSAFWSTAAVEFDVGMSTLKRWLTENKDFAEAKKKGEMLSMSWWENLGRAGSAGKLKGFNAVAYIYNMKNRFRDYGWNDKVETEHSGEVKINLKISDYRSKK